MAKFMRHSFAVFGRRFFRSRKLLHAADLARRKTSGVGIGTTVFEQILHIGIAHELAILVHIHRTQHLLTFGHGKQALGGLANNPLQKRFIASSGRGIHIPINTHHHIQHVHIAGGIVVNFGKLVFSGLGRGCQQGQPQGSHQRF